MSLSPPGPRTDASEPPRIFRLQALDRDPLFAGARYTFAVDDPAGGFDVVVVVSPYFVGLLSLEGRRELGERARTCVELMLEAGRRGPTTLRVSAEGTLRADDEILGALPVR